ncbi:hypothetical protein [Pseudomonas sp. RC10]|uniref:hypothetical protein n=1 Tax=Pseudomonas bambusae TaxID=3139142 RepID=UPI0031392CB8
MSNHTPGPWVVREVPNFGLPSQVGYAIDFNEDQEQVVDFVYEKPDAHLIAAAPELLAALEQLLGKAYKQNWNDLYPDQLAVAEAALAKARGDL